MTSKRAENYNRLAADGRMDLFWEIIWTLLIMRTRDVTQEQVAKHLGKSRTWVQSTMSAQPKLSHAALERNLVMIDGAIAELSRQEQIDEDEERRNDG